MVSSGKEAGGGPLEDTVHVPIGLENDVFHCAAVQAFYDTQAHRTHENQEKIYTKIARACLVFVQALATTLDEIDHFKPPTNYEQAMKREDWDSWLYCTLSEIEGMGQCRSFPLQISWSSSLRGFYWPPRRSVAHN